MYGTDENTIRKVYLNMAYSRITTYGRRSWDGYALPEGSLVINAWRADGILHAELTPSDQPHRGTMVELRAWESDDEDGDPKWMPRSLIEAEFHNRTRDIVARLKKLGFVVER